MDSRTLLEQLKDLCRDDHYLGIDDLPEEFEEVEDGDWTQDGKYQFSTSIVRHDPTGRFFAIHNTRSGSYHTDWYYQEPSVNEVRQVEKVITVTEWEPVKA
jgi:hypothetical protein